MSVEFKDNSSKVKSEFGEALLRGLEKCGLVALSTRSSPLLREIGAVSECADLCGLGCGPHQGRARAAHRRKNRNPPLRFHVLCGIIKQGNL